jgi:hypothetical protein
MNIFAKTFYEYRRILKALKLFLMISGPGIIVMLADNDAGGITTYAATGSSYGYNLIWFLILLLPVAYYVQEMTVRLGAVTKRGHAEAIFDGFGSFWGWFSLLDHKGSKSFLGDLRLEGFLHPFLEFNQISIFKIIPLAQL